MAAVFFTCYVLLLPQFTARKLTSKTNNVPKVLGGNDYAPRLTIVQTELAEGATPKS